MKTFNYTITEQLGLHARPAGVIAKAAKAYKGTTIIITKGDSSAKATQIIKLISLAAKKGDEIIVSFEGDDEEKAYAEMHEIMKNTL